MKIPANTISQFIPSQVPEFVNENFSDLPNLVSFVQAYYEWLENRGYTILTGRATSATDTTLVLSPNASDQVNTYQGYSVMINNGPAAGQLRRIDRYDADTKTIYINEPWNVIPIHFSNFSIVDDNNPKKLLEYADVDSTVDEFLDHFKLEFLHNIPGNILADKKLVLKHIREFYQARGSEKSYKFLFRILFNDDVEFYYPKVDLLKTSDGKWYVQKIIRITSSSNTFDWVNRKIVGSISGASAFVESVKQIQFGSFTVSELELSNVEGEFYITPFPAATLEPVYISEPSGPPVGSLEDPGTLYRIDDLYRIVTDVNVTDSGDDYKIGDPVEISGGGGYPAQAVVTSIYELIIQGFAQDPPTSVYLEPFWADVDGLTGQTVWGQYFWSDTELDYGNLYNISADQIYLANDSSPIDDFYVGDNIAISSGTGANQQRNIIAYDGNLKIATVDVAWTTTPNSTSFYQIFHTRGKIKKVQVTEFGVGFTSQPTVHFKSKTGALATGEAVLGALGVYPGRWIGTDGMLNSNKRIQDSYYWQDFSYVLRLGESIDKYRDTVKALLHPAGTKMFGEVLVQTKYNQGNLLRTVEELIIYLDTQLYKMKMALTVDHKLDFEFKANPLGTRENSIDRFKFTAFLPNSFVSSPSYSFPNQNYWLGTTANTQISHIADSLIGNIVVDPNSRMPFGFETYMKVRSDKSQTLVGPIGPSLRTMDFVKFVDSTIDLTQMAVGDPMSLADLPLDLFGDLPISQILDGHGSTNFVPDVYVTILGNPAIPVSGNVAQYDFREIMPSGSEPTTLLNISPANYNVEDGVLTSLTNLPVWTNYGLKFKDATVDATAVPVSLSGQTVIIVAMSPTLPAPLMTLASSTFSSSENGYSIEIGSTGTVNFRANMGDVPLAVGYPIKTIKKKQWFMAALRFDNGTLTGRVNNLLNRSNLYGSFSPPSANSAGWFLGKQSADYPGTALGANALSNRNRFGQVRFHQTQSTSSPLPVSNFSGEIAYALIFDRAIQDFELDSIYAFLRLEMAKRNIVLP